MNEDYRGELIFFSAIVGAIAALFKFFINQIFVWLKLAEPFYTEIITYLTFGCHHTIGIVEAAFSVIGDMTIGAVFGIILGHWLKCSRPHFHWWIGFGYGFIIWFASLTFGNLLKTIEKEDISNWSLFFHLIAMTSFGLFFVLVTKIWRPIRKRLIIS